MNFSICRWAECGLLLMLLLTSPVQATHLVGGEIGFAHRSGNQYRVLVTTYSDALGGTGNAQTLTLAAKANGCTLTGTGSFVAPLPQVATRAPGLPLCQTSPAPYQAIDYATTVALPPGQWTLAVNVEARSALAANILSAETTHLELQAYVDNRAGADQAPRFTALPLPYCALGQPYRYSFAAFDADGDSLVYRAVAPLNNRMLGGVTLPICPSPSPVSYRSYLGGQFTDPLTGQTAAFADGAYTAGMPLPSFRVLNGTVSKWVELTVANGNYFLAPARLDTYAVALQVDEYRRLNGQPTRIGSVMREVLYTVAPTLNTNPALTLLQNSAVLRGFTLRVTARPLTTTAARRSTLVAFPTPFSHTVSFHLAQPKAQVVVTDELGREVAQLRSRADGRVDW